MRKHIIYLLSDQHNPMVMGTAGDPVVRTPNLDALYRKGTGFDACYCAAPLCVPSRSAILSGELPTRTGVFNNMQALPTCNATFPASMTNAGYETVLCGRMHFLGWDQWHGYERRLVGDITLVSSAETTKRRFTVRSAVPRDKTSLPFGKAAQGILRCLITTRA